MKNVKPYEPARVEVITFSANDVIRTSSTPPGIILPDIELGSLGGDEDTGPSLFEAQIRE